MSESVIDPAILEEEQAIGKVGAGRRSTRSRAGTTSTRTSTRLASRPSTTATATATTDVVRTGTNGGGTKGKGREVEPARGEEENLIGSEYQFRGKRQRTGANSKSMSASASKSPVKKRLRLVSGGDESGERDEMARIEGLADAASVSRPNPPKTLFLLPPPYPIGVRPFRFPCFKPGHPAPPDSYRPFKRFDPHEFDDPKSLLEDTASLASDDDGDSDEKNGNGALQPGSTPTQTQSQSQSQPQTQYQTPAQSTNMSDEYTPYGMGGEMDYDTQAYQSLAALLEASNDEVLFPQHDGGGQ